MNKLLLPVLIFLCACGRIKTPADAIQDLGNTYRHASSTTITPQQLPVFIHPCPNALDEAIMCNADSTLFSTRLLAQLLPGHVYRLSCAVYITTNGQSTFVHSGGTVYSCNRR